MNWIVQNQFFILLAIFIAGLAPVWYFIFHLVKKIKIIFGVDAGNIEKNTLRRIVEMENKLVDIEPRLEAAEAISKMSIHKVGFLRFNPFQDTGGDNSFVVILLDRNNSGVVISSLYTRGGVRVYGKAIEKGKSRYPLSEEEKKVLEETLRK